jgi:hypothetical protein
MPTVDILATDSAGAPVPFDRCLPATQVADPHTRAEHAVYTALWNLGASAAAADLYRDVSIGYHKLGRLAGCSQRNMARLLVALLGKLAIEIVAQEISGLGQGKTYRVYAAAEILRRRREASYLWFLRDRATVRLVKILDPPAAMTLAAAPVSPPAAAPEPTDPALAKIRSILDDDPAAAKLCDRCRARDEKASNQEILHFLERALTEFRRQHVPGAANKDWRHELIARVSSYFDQPMLIERYRLDHEHDSC